MRWDFGWAGGEVVSCAGVGDEHATGNNKALENATRRVALANIRKLVGRASLIVPRLLSDDEVAAGANAFEA
jgi:hypothetical protein